MKAILYANGLFHNKGCEAIARGAHKILSEKDIELAMGTSSPANDQAVADEMNVQAIRIPRIRETFLNVASDALRRIKLKKISIAIPFVALKKLGKAYDYSFSMGGDNYCYPGRERFYRMNRSIRNKKCKNFFWGCSLEESDFDQLMKKDLEGFDVIFPREARTYNMLLEKGFTNVVKCTDPAFVMEKQECHFAEEPDGKKYIGFNISPLTLSCSPDPAKVFEDIVRLIETVLEKTEYDVLLIPHVYGPESDYAVHCRIAAAISCGRVKVIPEEYSAPQLKYIISKCEAFVGSRTHATIAAYSTCVPTLVLGYSVKSVGIAEDLFGTADGYVLKAQDGITYDRLEAQVMNLIANKDKVKEHLSNIMDAYIENAYIVSKVIGDGKVVRQK